MDKEYNYYQSLGLKHFLKNKESDSRIFSNIYKNNEWQNGSGPGSSIHFNKEYIEFLKEWIPKNNINTIIDIGCGDWQFGKILYPSLNINYIGIDCSPLLINLLNKKYKKEHIKFLCIDAIEDINQIPNGDLYIIKDVLQHWPDDKVLFFINTCKEYKKTNKLLITNCYQLNLNKNIEKNGKEMRALPSSHEIFKNFKIESLLKYNTKETILCSLE